MFPQFGLVVWLSVNEKPNADTDLILVAYRGVVWCGLYDRDDDSITFLLVDDAGKVALTDCQCWCKLPENPVRE